MDLRLNFGQFSVGQLYEMLQTIRKSPLVGDEFFIREISQEILKRGKFLLNIDMPLGKEFINAAYPSNN